MLLFFKHKILWINKRLKSYFKASEIWFLWTLIILGNQSLRTSSSKCNLKNQNTESLDNTALQIVFPTKMKALAVKPFPPFSFNTHLTFPPKLTPQKIKKPIKVTSYLQLDKSNRYFSVSLPTCQQPVNTTVYHFNHFLNTSLSELSNTTAHSSPMSLAIFLCRLSSPTHLYILDFLRTKSVLCNSLSTYTPFSYIISSVPLVLILTIDHKPKFIISKPNLYHELWIHFVTIK